MLSIVAIASAIVTITNRNPVVSAMSLIVHFFMLAGLYLTLHAQFVAVVQILVYAGAIMVLVVFVILLLNLKNEVDNKEKFSIRKILAVIFALAFIVQFIAIYFSGPLENKMLHSLSVDIGTAQGIGSELFTNYLLPFEAIALLLLAAIIGAMLLAKRKLD